MDASTLISFIYKNPPIWDNRIKDYSNRNIVDKCWKDVADQMGVEDAMVRKKWKYLRDQFTVELGKIKSSNSEPSPGETSVPKWRHFKSLLFLKDIVKPRQYSGKLTSKNSEMLLETGGEVDDGTELEEGVLHCVVDVDENEDFDVTGTYGSLNNLHDSSAPSENCNLTQETNCKRKRSESSANYSSIVEIDKKNAQFLETLYSRQEENEDLLFFRSLLPHLKNIPQCKKLRFRNRIQEVVEEFAYPPQSSSS